MKQDDLTFEKKALDNAYDRGYKDAMQKVNDLIAKAKRDAVEEYKTKSAGLLVNKCGRCGRIRHTPIVSGTEGHICCEGIAEEIEQRHLPKEDVQILSKLDLIKRGIIPKDKNKH